MKSSVSQSCQNIPGVLREESKYLAELLVPTCIQHSLGGLWIQVSFTYSKEELGTEIKFTPIHREITCITAQFIDLCSPQELIRAFLDRKTSLQHPAVTISGSIKVFPRFLKNFFPHKFLALRVLQQETKVIIPRSHSDAYRACSFTAAFPVLSIRLSGKQLLMLITHGTEVAILKRSKFHSYYILSAAIPQTRFTSHKFL